LDLGLIRKGATRIVSPLTGDREDLSWSIITIPSKFLPISVVACRLVGMGHTVFGYGDSLFYTDSLTQAFAEAWERLWFELTRQHSSDSSNGFACGATPAAAEDAARAELIERSIYLTAWNTRRGWSPIPTAGIFNHILTSSLEAMGWKLSLFRLSETKLGDVICGLGTRPQGGILFDCCYRRPGISENRVQTKILRSLLRTALALDHRPVVYAPLPKHGGPSAHQEFYMEPAHSAAFDFLSAQDSVKLEIGGYEETESRIIADVKNFPCVASASNPRWPRLAWGEESLIVGGNKWPHPLA
jgi:hypothetical protein